MSDDDYVRRLIAFENLFFNIDADARPAAHEPACSDGEVTRGAAGGAGGAADGAPAAAAAFDKLQQPAIKLVQLLRVPRSRMRARTGRERRARFVSIDTIRQVKITSSGKFRRNLPKLKKFYVIRNPDEIRVTSLRNRKLNFAKVPGKFLQTDVNLRNHVITVIS